LNSTEKIDENKSRSVTNKQEHINIIGTTRYTMRIQTLKNGYLVSMKQQITNGAVALPGASTVASVQLL